MHIRIPNRLLVILTLTLSWSSIGLASDVYSLEEWAKRANMSSVSLSPDGNRLALLKIATKDGNPILEVYDANNLSKRPFRMNAEPMEITTFDWVSADSLIFSARMKVRDKIDDWNQGVYEYKGGMLTLDKKAIKNSKWKTIRSIAGIQDTLPRKKNKILMYGYEEGSRYPSYYEFDLKSKSRRLVTRESPKVNNFGFDDQGRPRLGSGRDSQTNEWLTYYRGPDSSEWKVINRSSEDSFEEWRVLGFDPASSEDLLVLAHNGNDKTGLWSFNPETLKYKELLYRRSDVDLNGVQRHSNPYTNPGEIVSVSYYDGRNIKREFFDGGEQAIYEQLIGLIPHADRLRISSRSEDGNSMIISNRGPRDPGTYYLLKNGSLSVVGSSKPQFSSEKLADVEAITYKSRDGKTIRGFITVPNSKPPYSLVVMPHGGPFVGENPSFDEWAQLLANRGFMVLQPQYRGSKNYGLDFYMSAFIDGGQGGYKMQDDKDDGALYLAEQGLVDPNRMMMFGWSYGGYSALAAASRTPQIYQCVVAGASVPDPNEQVNYYRFSMRGAQKDEQLRMWDDSLSPIKEVANVNVPMLIVHGDVDQRTPPRAARTYIKALEDNNKQFKSLWLEGADHFSNTLFYRHKLKFYTALTDYLDNDCFTGSQTVASK